jgi:hypothetical protein
MINKIVFFSLMTATGITLALLVSTAISYKQTLANECGVVIGFKSQLDADNFAQNLYNQHRSYTKVYIGQLCSIRWNDAMHDEYQDLMDRRQELGIRCIDTYGWRETTYAPMICFDSQESLHLFVAQLDKEIEINKTNDATLAWHLDAYGSLYTQDNTTIYIKYPELAEAKYQELWGKEKEHGITAMHLYS